MLIQRPLVQFMAHKAMQLLYPKAITFQSARFPFCLTFDDGPSEHTPYILDVLDKLNLKACFFLVGKQIESYPHYFEEILNRGHAVGNHSYSHISARKQSMKEVIHDILKVQSMYPFEYYRPPYGHTSTKIVKKVEEIGLQTVLWNKLAVDWDSGADEFEWKKLCENLNRNYDVLVLHDSIKAFPQLQKICEFLLLK